MKQTDQFLTRARDRIQSMARDERANFAVENPEVAFLANELIQCTLPHSNPGCQVTTYKRTNGLISLVVDSGKNPKTLEAYGIPYGIIPRLLLYYIITEAVRSKSPHITFGRNLADFMRAIGLNPRMGTGARSDYRRMIDQANRLFSARITFAPSDEAMEQDRFIVPRFDMVVTRLQDLWWSPHNADESTIFESYIDLSADFFDAITSSPVPVSLRALRELKGSALALDLYGWATYRTYLVNRKGSPSTIPLVALRKQFGAEYSDQKEFNRNFKKALAKVKTVYPGFTYDDQSNPGHLVVFPGEPHVSRLPD